MLPQSKICEKCNDYHYVCSISGKAPCLEHPDHQLEGIDKRWVQCSCQKREEKPPEISTTPLVIKNGHADGGMITTGYMQLACVACKKFACHDYSPDVKCGHADNWCHGHEEKPATSDWEAELLGLIGGHVSYPHVVDMIRRIEKEAYERATKELREAVKKASDEYVGEEGDSPWNGFEEALQALDSASDKLNGKV